MTAQSVPMPRIPNPQLVEVASIIAKGKRLSGW
jgi:hypothetical protein